MRRRADVGRNARFVDADDVVPAASDQVMGNRRATMPPSPMMTTFAFSGNADMSRYSSFLVAGRRGRRTTLASPTVALVSTTARTRVIGASAVCVEDISLPCSVKRRLTIRAISDRAQNKPIHFRASRPVPRHRRPSIARCAVLGTVSRGATLTPSPAGVFSPGGSFAGHSDVPE